MQPVKTCAKKIIFAVLLLTLEACTQSAPLQSLSTAELSKEYDLPYWLHEASNHSALWQQALQYCQQQIIHKPNCQIVDQVSWLQHIKQEPPQTDPGFGPGDL